MIDLLTKGVLTGIGLAALTKEKVEEIAKELVEQGNATEQEGKKFIEEMVGYAGKSKEVLEKQVNSYVEKALDKMDLVRKSDIDELKNAIVELQSRLDKKDE